MGVDKFFAVGHSWAILQIYQKFTEDFAVLLLRVGQSGVQWGTASLLGSTVVRE